jgi:hypothetical protein
MNWQSEEEEIRTQIAIRERELEVLLRNEDKVSTHLGNIALRVELHKALAQETELEAKFHEFQQNAQIRNLVYKAGMIPPINDHHTSSSSSYINR